MRSPLSSRSKECANCAIAFSWEGVETPAGVFCCAGCAHGGPCTCTYTGASAAAKVGGHREHALTLAVQPLRGQIDVAEFGGALERVPGVLGTALVGTSGDRAVFRVGTTSIPDVLLNLRRIPGFAATIAKIEGECVELSVHGQRRAGAPAATGTPAATRQVLQEVLNSLDRVAAALAKPPGERSSVGNLAHLSEDLMAARSLLTGPESATAPPPVSEPRPAADEAPPAAAPRAPERPPATEEWPGAGAGRLMSDRFVLIAYPFHNFHSLNAFQRAVRGLEGVRDARVSRFFKGTLHLQVEYQGVISFADRLREIAIRHHIVQIGDESVELEIEETAGDAR